MKKNKQKSVENGEKSRSPALKRAYTTLPQTTTTDWSTLQSGCTTR